MIKIKVAELLGKNKMTRKRLAELANIRQNTVSDFYYETVKRIDVNALNNMCNVFGCKVEDILEFVPDEKK